MLVLQVVRNIAGNDSLGKALDRCRLADTGLADQDRVVLALSGQDQNGLTNLIVTPDDRVQLLLARFLHQI